MYFYTVKMKKKVINRYITNINRHIFKRKLKFIFMVPYLSHLWAIFNFKVKIY